MNILIQVLVGKVCFVSVYKFMRFQWISAISELLPLCFVPYAIIRTIVVVPPHCEVAVGCSAGETIPSYPNRDKTTSHCS